MNKNAKPEQLTRAGLTLVKQAPTTPLQRAVDSFLLDAEARRLTAKTLRFYRQQLNPFLGYLRERQVTSLPDHSLAIYASAR